MTTSGSTSSRPPVAIVGAGIAGLVAARELRRRGIPVVVFEASAQVAGMAKTVRDNHEAGRLSSVINDARLEKILAEHDPLK